MNTHHNTLLRLSTSLTSDLANAQSLSLPVHPSRLGSLSASLTSFTRELEIYSSLQKSELNAPKKEKAGERTVRFRNEEKGFKKALRELKERNEGVREGEMRGELLGRRPYGSNGAGQGEEAPPKDMNPYASSGQASAQASMSIGSGDNDGDPREAHALREQTFFTNTHTALDEYLARGQAVLGDLAQQREVMKGTQRRLYSVANTLGISGDTIRMVERRARQDKWVFWGGVLVFLGFCWACLHWLR